MRSAFRVTLPLALCLTFVGTVFAADYRYDKKCSDYYYHDDDHLCVFDDWEIELDKDQTLIIRPHHGRGEIVITEDYALYINGRHVRTDDEADELIEEFYHGTMEMVDEAIVIGAEAAVIGIAGAGIGIGAIGGTVRMLLTDYTEEEFERDIEREAEKLEREAEKLEDRAEVIEDMSEDLEEVAEDLADRVPELRRLDWFRR